uniref:Putative secreted protein n=1 Tax=Ixodes scapularis TaxID=6945 RepID=A0A4D5RYW6_IXOSC
MHVTKELRKLAISTCSAVVHTAMAASEYFLYLLLSPRYLTKTTQACLVATETCPEGADAGKERALKLLLAFAQIWS